MDAYIQVIREAFLFFPIIAALLAVPYILYNYHKFGSVLSLRVVIIYSFILYLLCAFFLVILPLPTRAKAAALTTPRVQKIPFHCMQDILREYRESGGGGLLALINNRAFLQVAFNVIMLVPFGVYLRYYFRCGFFTTMVLSFLLSLFFELTQLSGLYFIYPRSYRLFDVDDLMANTFGGICGYIGVTPFLWLLPSRAEMDDRSFRLSREVSAFRRLTAALFDLFWAGGVSLLVCLLVKRKMGLPLRTVLVLALSMMFLLLPLSAMVLRGRSPGKAVTHLRIVRQRGGTARWYQLLGRYVLMYLIPAVPYFLSRFYTLWEARQILNQDAALVAKGLLVCLYCAFLLMSAIRMALHKPLFYERLSRTKVVSTLHRD